MDNFRRVDQSQASEQMDIFLRSNGLGEGVEERRLDGVYELLMSQMSVNACQENYSWINQPADRLG